MNLPQQAPRHHHTVLLSCVELVVTRLVRLLVGRMSLVRLRELVDKVFVEEAEARLRAERPTGTAPLAQIALLTGLDTRSVHRIRNHPGYRKPIGQDQAFIRNFSPTANITGKWVADARFQGKDGKAKKLTVTGPANSIEMIMREEGVKRGVTPHAVVERLAASGQVVYDREAGTVELVDPRYVVMDDDTEGMLEIGFTGVAKLMDTVLWNIESEGEDRPRLFQRCLWSLHLLPHMQEEVRAKLRDLLATAEEQCRSYLAGKESGFASPHQFTAGVGLYYFEEAAGGAA